MKKKRPGRKSQKPPPAGRRGGRTGTGRAPALRPSAAPKAAPGPLQFKVVELSTVDEGSLERTANEWVGKGWNLENVQFAMRESSKRPAMAFVFFTREGPAAEVDDAGARDRLRRLSEGPEGEPGWDQGAPMVPAVSPYERLRQLAEEDDAASERPAFDPEAGAQHSGLRVIEPEPDE